MNTIVVKVTTKSGNYWTTEINGTIDEVTNYFINYTRFYVTEDQVTGKEIRDLIVKVEQLKGG
jgi:hypothetical protein